MSKMSQNVRAVLGASRDSSLSQKINCVKYKNVKSHDLALKIPLGAS